MPETETSILPGKGLFGSMLSWMTGSDAPVESTKEPRSARFDPAEFMRSLLAYERRHRRRLHGAGLVLGVGDELLPASMNAISRLRGYRGDTDTVSFQASDYTGDGYQTAIQTLFERLRHSELTFEGLAPRQVAHLANAVCVRAAIQMASFATGDPAISILDDGSARVDFVPAHGSDVDAYALSITVGSHNNAMNVPGAVKATLRTACYNAFDSALTDVASEFDTAVRAGLSKEVADLVGTEPLLKGLPPLTRMANSFPTFSNLRGLYAANTRFMASLSRPALVDALRHGRFGWSLGAYRAHADPQVAAEVEASQHLGALSFAGYSPRTLRLLWEGHTGRRASPPQPGNPVSLLQSYHRDPSAIAHAFVAQLREDLSPSALAQLAQLSPKYLAQPVIGAGVVAALGEDSVFEPNGPTRASRAGRRLAAALSEIADPALGRKGLPWADVLASSRARDLLTGDFTEEEAAAGLRALIAYCNAQRSRGMTAAHVLSNLPSTAALIEAPAGAQVPSLLRLQDPVPTRPFRAAQRCAMKLLDQLLKEAGPLRTKGPERGVLSGQVHWSPALVGFERGNAGDERARASQAASLVIALRDAKSGKHWQRMRLTASLDESADGQPQLRLAVDPRPPDAHLPVVDGAPTTQYQPQNLISLPGVGISSPHLIYRDFSNPILAAQARHAQALGRAWRDRFNELVRQHPAELAALLSPVAQYILAGRDSPQRPVVNLGAARGLRLARVSMSIDNREGFELIVCRMRDPRATMANGASLLDIALESHDTSFAKAAMQSLAKHPVLAGDPTALRQIVQKSLGKLVERHPDLLGLAVECGAALDSTTLAAWEALHPHLKSPEATAGLMAARMRAAIDATRRAPTQIPEAAVTAAAANDLPAAPLRRRAGL